ncbi:cytochrome c biogenesis protein ResB [Actinospica sp. MGRD01-02]|uniref:Cytochrome c biogenesis protein ResB n=1 Tax=Actinospica acidithermotolerans TaxID=2828514 RepID=A0A941EGW5_9ACTN|nr:cytochrome c biogenesis protein ResB [Actinospica acidithermotolerans]MBR7827419.1 cytochrome c biogenesis protein ResB [Actinospica acidithermotolerans]
MSEQTQDTVGTAPAADADPPEPVEQERLTEDAVEAAAAERAEKLSTAPRTDDGIAVPSLGALGMLRWTWRQLTSMRIALVLLFMLSLAAIPGSILPQNSIDPSKVTTFYQSHTKWAPILNDLRLFDVFESPWFGAIYGLLFISLIGCIVPRSWAHFKAMRANPPAAPRNLKRLPVHASFSTTAEADEVLKLAAKRLRGRRFKTVRGEDRAGGWVSSEKGFLRETGNLLFHLSLIGILIGIAIGHFLGYKGAVLVTEGTGFSDTVTSYDSLTLGPWVGAQDLPDFSFTLNKFSATYQESGDQFAQPRTFDAYVSFKSSPSAKARNEDVQVNSPMTINGTNVFLEGHGYSPVVEVKNGKGDVLFDGPVTFLGQDEYFDSSGAIKAPSNVKNGTDLGFQGWFLPTAYISSGAMPASIFPAAQNPMLILSAYSGNLNMNGGEDQSVYSLDTTDMKQLNVKSKSASASAGNALELKVGQTATLPNELGSITFVGVKQWAQFNIAYDPGQKVVLPSAVLAVLGLIGSLGLRRRRIWVRVTEQADGTRLVEVAGLARTEGATPTAEVTQTAQSLAAAVRQPVPDGAPA